MYYNYEIRFQNRSHYVTSESASQWKMLDQWKRNHQESLYSFLTPNLVLFGEWLYSKHSIHYTRLPDYFLAFDMYQSSRWGFGLFLECGRYDKEAKKFLSIQKRDELLQGTGIRTVPSVGQVNTIILLYYSLFSSFLGSNLFRFDPPPPLFFFFLLMFE